MSTLKQIKVLEKKRDMVLGRMLSVKSMMPGAYKKVYCRCGKKNCWCYHGMGHPYTRITWYEAGKSKTKSINEKNIRWIKQVTQNYRDFKKDQKKIREYEERLKELLDKYSKEITIKTRMKKGYN
ncbi:MAG: hypothetical protein ISS14_04910 [Actinobacteria bacterium]|nr:hypothetical protein [Actinomycetota bacterium]MBL7124211.1 hypothetical protein [Actinomycetota bacterium]